MAKLSLSPKRPKIVVPPQLSGAQLQRIKQWHASGFTNTVETYKDHVFKAWIELQAALDLVPLMGMHITAFNDYAKKGAKKCK